MIADSQLATLKDLTKFAPAFLTIKNKAGRPIPFELNQAQLYAHGRLEAQLKEMGRVRALVLKGRQQGLSTLIQARFFHKVITVRGQKAFILTHEAEATKNLFEMTKRYYETLPAGLCPEADRSSAKELRFTQFDSGYSVGTAGNKSVGRSQTIQLFHGCIAEGTKVYEPIYGGIRNIEQFKVGDSVLTHNGNIAPISYISTQDKPCVSVILRTLTKFPLIATKEHRFWTKTGWKELGDINVGDSIGYPICEITDTNNTLYLPKAPLRSHGGGRQSACKDVMNVDYNFGRLVGLYLAEGHIKLQSTAPYYPAYISFAVHRNEVARTVEWLLPFNDYYSSISVRDRKDSLTSVVILYGNRLASFINQLCGRTTGKHLPWNWRIMGKEFCRGLLHAYISGDGSSYDTDRRVRASSICNAITVSLRDIAASLGYGWASIEYKEAGKRRNRNEKEQYTFSLCGDGASRLAYEIGKPTVKIRNAKTKSIKRNAANTTEIWNGYAWLRIKSIDDVGIKKVYDFEVDHDDHSYCTIHAATHNSEVAYWPTAEEHAKGVMEAVSNEPGTEIILESTANGIGNYFHQMWQSAKTGTSEYQAIFVPWYWEAGYTAKHEGFRLDEEEQALLDFYSHDGLTIDHLAWRRLKIHSSHDNDAAKERFYSEYPMSAEEAFRNPIDNVFINAKYVMRARKNDVQSDTALIIGVDPAISDKDKTAIIRRRGRQAYNLETFRNHNTMEIAGRIAAIIRQEQPTKVYIDCIGVGAGVVDRLIEMGFSMVEGINVGRTANNKERFANLRAELWSEMRDWLYQNELPVQIPDDDELHGALCSLGFKYRSNEQLLIESKDDLRARCMPSPDEADALSLTFFAGVYNMDISYAPIIQNFHEKGMFT
jgi:hypothetical protein